MSWDEKLFGRFYDFYTNKLEARRGQEYLLENYKKKLTILAEWNWGYPVQIVAVADEAFFDGENLYLPEKIRVKCDKDLAYTFYVLNSLLLTAPIDISTPYLEIVSYLKYKYPGLTQNLEHLIEKFPHLFNGSNEDLQKKWGSRSFTEAKSHIKRNSQGQIQIIKDAENTKKLSVKLSRSKKIKRLAEFDNSQDENPLVHTLEKIFTLDQFKGGNKKIEASDELDEHQKALKELKIDSTLNSTEQAVAFIKAELADGHDILEESSSQETDKIFRYPEWNYKKASFKRNWVKLHEGKHHFEKKLALSEDEKNVAHYLQNNFKAELNERRWQRGLLQGNELDLDRLIHFKSDLNAKTQPSERIYQNKELHIADWSVLILLDRSLSTDSWIGDSRILDLEFSILKVVMNVLENEKISWSAASFFSNTRHEVRFDWISQKSDRGQGILFDESAIKPRGSTRLGPVIRHATEILKKDPSSRKMLLFLSDLKPTDFDFYEGLYGVHDFRKAVAEARVESIDFHMFGFSVDSHQEIRKYFSPQEYSRISDLKKAKTSLWSWLKRHSR
ncbi:MAG: nitric oxide reductase activation protein NorD [Bdellovibrionia bacterium]